VFRVFWDVFWGVLAALAVWSLVRWLWQGGRDRVESYFLIAMFVVFVGLVLLGIAAFVSMFSPRVHAWLKPLFDKIAGN
jgi:predicted PurR-regulated permease PerM